MKINYIPLSKAKELLESESKKRELTELQKSALNHATKFSKLTAEKAVALQEEIISYGLSEQMAAKIVDILPANIDELRSIVFPGIQNLDNEIANKILEAIGKFR
jgi:DNA-directed RNA polymerase subunit F